MSASDNAADMAIARTALDRFLDNYGQPDQVQASSAGRTDSELKNLSLLLADAISKSDRGTVIDIGCGNGIVLSRLAEIEAFRRRVDWTYFGCDHIERTESVLHLAVSIKLHRRVDVNSLDHFYASWIPEQQAPRPHIVVIRNVFHELRITATASLISLLVNNCRPEDMVCIQDLQVFPVAERGNVCWNPSFFVELMTECGFKCAFVEEPSKSGNHWFSLTARRISGGSVPSVAEISDLVVQKRRDQFDLWSQMGSLVPHDATTRSRSIALVDFDLQKAALQQQLSEIQGSGIAKPSDTQQSAISTELFAKHLGTFDIAVLTNSIVPLDRPLHFRNRAHSQDDLEVFLRSAMRVTVIHGGPLIGKTDLVAEVLARRAHNRQAVTIDVQHTSSVWNLLEQYLAGIGCTFPYDILGTFTSLKYADVKEVVSSFATRLAQLTVIAIDHCERLLDPDGSISDVEVQEFLKALLAAPESKVIITSRRQLAFSFLPPDYVDYEQRQVGRMPGNDHIENILDDFVDRSRLHIDHYPPELLAAIDRFPYLAVLAGKVIAKEGPPSLTDSEFLTLIQNKLRDELIRRIVTDAAWPAIELLKTVRIPVPKEMFSAIAGVEAVDEAIRLGILYPSFDYARDDLLTGPSLLRTSFDAADDHGEASEPDSETIAETARHHTIAEWYARLYRSTSDPRWMRELYYHVLAIGDQQGISRFGVAYRGELFWAGNFWFRTKKDYPAALDAYEGAAKLGLATYQLELRLASCLIRVGRAEEGEERYSDLIAQFPNARGVKTSYIDGLLYRREYARALEKMNEFGFSIGIDPWVSHEFGRAFMGLSQFKDAVRAFEAQRRQEPTAIAMFSLAQAYQAAGRRDDVGRVLLAGCKRFPTNRKLKIAFATHLIRGNETDELMKAEALLWQLHNVRPSDAGVLHQLVKALCLLGRVSDATTLVHEQAGQIEPKVYATPIRVELLTAQGRWNDAIAELRGVQSSDKHLVGLKKKVYLAWARAESDFEQKQAIAKRGLDAPVSPGLLHNIPILVTSARLARLADNREIYEEMTTTLATINAEIAVMVRNETANLNYWEDASIDL